MYFIPQPVLVTNNVVSFSFDNVICWHIQHIPNKNRTNWY